MPKLEETSREWTMRRGLCDGLRVCDEGTSEQSEAFTRRDETRRSVHSSRVHLARFCCPTGRDNDETRDASGRRGANATGTEKLLVRVAEAH